MGRKMMAGTVGKGKEVYDRKRVRSLKPSPENEELYDSVKEASIDFKSFVASIRKNGCVPLTITKDNFIVSGHRRREALITIGQQFVRCQVLPKRRDEFTKDEYIALLRAYNRQRQKTVAEQVREEVVDIDPDAAHRSLCQQRDKSLFAAEGNSVTILEIEGSKVRHGISGDKDEHVKHIKQIILVDRRAYWPLSCRGVHYPLLNFGEFVRGYYWPRKNEPGHGTRQTLYYRNDDKSYDATAELLTRLRLNGDIPWQALDDGTRPLQVYRPFQDVRRYVRQEVNSLFSGYWRDLLQSQPNHIEIVCEKNTIYHMVLRVSRKYQITTSSGRGFNSIDPWHDLYERYMASGKERLIVITLTDWDPEGQQIPQVAGRTLRDDFEIPEEKLLIVPAGVTREQITKYSLKPQSFAKEGSSNRDWFVERNDGDDTVYELEAIDPANMLADLDDVVRSVLDIDLFNREVEIERQEAAFIAASKKAATEALRGLDL